jgi:hypothetical protein
MVRRVPASNAPLLVIRFAEVFVAVQAAGRRLPGKQWPSDLFVFGHKFVQRLG